MSITFRPVSGTQFRMALRYAQLSSLVSQCTSPLTQEHADDFNTTCFLSESGRTGYLIHKGTLESVFNLDGNGYGADAVRDAIGWGAWRLDCFDGFLLTYYARFGFSTVKREANYNGPGFPDVVYMALPAVIEVR
jgi:hypothetical protein